MTRLLTTAEIVAINRRIIGAPIRDLHLLESAVARPATTAFGIEQFTTLADKAGVLMHGILRNHPFADGNKRTAWISVQILLELNGAQIVGVGQREAAEAVRDAVADRWSPEDISSWISARMVETPFTDGPLS